jgi:hypothetical protein
MFSHLRRSIVMANYEETIKMPLNEPAPGKRKSQIQGSAANIYIINLNQAIFDAIGPVLRSRSRNAMRLRRLWLETWYST